MPSRVKLVDIVNLNSKASCLSAERWLRALKGGTKSELYNILRTYVELKSKVTLGIIGSTLVDIKIFNPESVQLIKDNPERFELIYRPYVHSLSIFWRDKIFKDNVALGKKVIDENFTNIFHSYLPPEFVLRNSQLLSLKKMGILNTFIHPNRVKSDVKIDIPKAPFKINTIQRQQIECIPFNPHFDAQYLASIQQLGMSPKLELQDESKLIFGWRDGESPFFLPNSVIREKHFIEQSSKQFNRVFLKDVYQHGEATEVIDSYPQNSLLPWFSNFRLLWYINEVKLLEATNESLTEVQRALFLMLLNSDELSSTEKGTIKIRINSINQPGIIKPYTIKRQSRNLEAEEIMYLIENCNDQEILDYFSDESSAFIACTKAELNYIIKAKS